MNDLLNRAKELADHVPALNPRKRLEMAAQDMDRAALLQMGLNTVTGSLVALSGILFNQSGGRYANIDTQSRRILIAVPWGSHGWKRWNLRKWEGECLRFIIQCKEREGGSPFVSMANHWHVARGWDDRESLLHWAKDTITLEDWRDAVDMRRDYYRELMENRRGAK